MVHLVLSKKFLIDWHPLWLCDVIFIICHPAIHQNKYVCCFISVGEVDFREVCPVLGHAVANHWTRNGKWLDSWSFWKGLHRCFGVCKFFSSLPPYHPFSFLTYPLCTGLDFLGTHPHSKMGSLNLYVSMNLLPSCWVVPWSCWGRSKTMPGVSFCHSS